MKSTELLLICTILSDIGLVLDTSIERDSAYVESRIEHEGLSFCTISLPSFAKDFERSLELGYVGPGLFAGFHKLRKAPLIPAFLSGITAYVFDNTGRLREDASIEAIEGVRQVCLALNKPKMECSDDRRKKAIENYVNTENDLRSFRPKAWHGLNDFVRISRVCFGRTLRDLNREVETNELQPRHGPGAVAERIYGNGKYRSSTWSRRLERSFPFDMYKVPNWNFTDREAEVRVGSDTVRVVFVPKTMKAPRVIAIEPINNQYAQQAVSQRLMALLERDRVTRERVNFSSSEFNRVLAREASISRNNATLDMSEASDRIHAGLVYHMFRDFPCALRSVFDCRSKYAILPDGRKVSLVKFASMGSALCFPVESMYHYVLCIMGGLKAENLQCNTRNILRLSRRVTVFGDDLIVPSKWRADVETVLASVRCVVNTKKSFSLGYFRESCGVDAYKGSIVTPVYIRTRPPKNVSDASELVSYVATANLFYRKGYWKTAQFMRDIVEDILGPLPHVGNKASVIGWTSFQGHFTFSKWNADLHRFEVRGYVPKISRRRDQLDGADRLMKFFLTRRDEPVEQEDFISSVDSYSLTLRKRWSNAS
ncbi:RNA-directed RNA polymerase [ssRNA phage SRR6960803_14]|uniref:RNA-directed RNA polymerase n=1 Tax=ssRNA phage SRR6960803_14 TaxID=2786617 RepID=A0A8S5L3H7_9VIRU|nr:RNA-directed RNA polymerase [ssRNA phage SRR6960803_14]DAD52326.1 TPA_asm: RNA-directed RNA polymerase [ssRNA phage SRR6960803_14]